METTSRVRPKAGDICSLETPLGIAYFQFTHKHKMYGALIRALPGLHSEEPDLAELIKEKEIYTTFFPLAAACSRGVVRIEAEAEVKKEWKEFPTFRSAATGPNGAKGDWWLWNGKKEWKIGKLNKEQESLPVRGVCNDTYLIEKLIGANQSLLDNA